MSRDLEMNTVLSKSRQSILTSPATSPNPSSRPTPKPKLTEWLREKEDPVWHKHARILKDKAVDSWKEMGVDEDAKIADSALKLFIALKASAAGKQTFRRFSFLNHLNLLWPYERELLAIEHSFHVNPRSLLHPEKTQDLRTLLAGYSTSLFCISDSFPQMQPYRIIKGFGI
jgi:hypothetical protein